MSKRILRIALVAASLLALGGCSAGTGTSGADAKPASRIDVSAYQKAAEEAMAPAKFQGPTAGPTAKAGAKVMVLACGLAAEGCKGPSEAATEAGKVLGWDVHVVDGQFDPEIYNRAMAQAVDQHYDAILLLAISSEAISESLKRARNAGIVVASWDGANTASKDGVSFEVDQPIAQQGINMANYLVWKSDGNLNAMLLRNPEFKVVTTWLNSAQKIIQGCKTCKIVRQDDFTADDAANRLPTLVTQALRQNPNINAVIGGYDAAMVSTVPSLAAAGLNRQARVVAFNGIPAFIEYVREGKAAATSAVAIRWGAWAAFDNINRLLQGQDIVAQKVPTRLITKENVDQIPANQGWNGDVNYKAAFTKIWQGK